MLKTARMHLIEHRSQAGVYLELGFVVLGELCMLPEEKVNYNLTAKLCDLH